MSRQPGHSLDPRCGRTDTVRRRDESPRADLLRSLRQFERMTVKELQSLLESPFDPRSRELLNREVGAAEDRGRRLDGMILRRQAERRVEFEPQLAP